MTLRDFQKTRIETNNIRGYITGLVSNPENFPPSPGFLYLRSLWIEKTDNWDSGVDADFYLRIANQEYQSDNLDDLEMILWKYAVSEGYIA